MKDLGKIILGSAIGMLLASIVMSVFSFIAFAGLLAASATMSSTTAIVPQNAILDIDMAHLVIGEQTLEDNPFNSNFQNMGAQTEKVSTLGILDAVNALQAAAEDPAIKLAYIRPDMASDISHIEEFRNALVKFRSSGKPVIAFIDTPTNAGFWLASAADRIYMSEYSGGMNMLVGLNGRMLFVKDLLDKLGIRIQLIRHGKYKAAGEMFVKNSASEENLEQNTVLIKGLWNEMASRIAERAGMDTDRFNAAIDNLELDCPGAFADMGLVDELVSYEGMKAKLCAHSGAETYSDINSISLADYAAVKTAKKSRRADDVIAVIYADGEIVDGHAAEQVAGKRFADIIRDVAEDDNVKAVVLRVNSPGGSVIASSQIKGAVDSLRSRKPVVASYGSYAASGGYWISAGCDYIFSDATTVTGSIGVFGMIPDISGTLKDVAHVNVTSVPSNSHSDMYSMTRPLDAKEVAFVQKDIENIYTNFVTLVSEGRKIDAAKVDELGQGRVWSGKDALDRGLVDRIGGLKEAVEYAANLVGSYTYNVENYPKPLTFLEQLIESFQPAQSGNLVQILSEIKEAGKVQVCARLPYSLEIR